MSLILYLSITIKALGSVILQVDLDEEKTIYFVNKVLQGDKLRYQKIERLTLAVIITERKLRPIFKGRQIIVTTNYLIKQVLKNLYLAGRMRSWSVEVFEHGISFMPQINFKSQALEDFLVDFIMLVEVESLCLRFLLVGESSNFKGIGKIIVLKGLGQVLLE